MNSNNRNNSFSHVENPLSIDLTEDVILEDNPYSPSSILNSNVLPTQQHHHQTQNQTDETPFSLENLQSEGSTTSGLTKRYSHHINLDTLENEIHPDSNRDEYEAILHLMAKASIHVSKALDSIEHRSREENKEWSKSNSEYYKKVVTQCNNENRLQDSKGIIYTTWISQIESHYSTTNPETQIVISNLRKAHETLFDPDHDHFDQSFLSRSQTLDQSSSSVRTHIKAPLSPLQTTDDSSTTKFNKYKEKATKFLLKKFTIVDMISNYKKEYLQYDISVGLSSGSIIIPQSMAYSLLAGLPPIYGLYSAFVPSLVYTLFGSSKHLAVGPLALMSILVGSAVQSLEPATMVEYIGLANILTLLIGLNFLLMSFLQLGFLINFLSRPVLSGFTSAAAVIIIFSMSTSLIGVPSTNQQYAWKYAIYLINHIAETNWIAVVIAVFCLLLLYIFKTYLKTIPRTTIPIPAPLILVIIGLILSYTIDLEGKGISVVGKIPSGLPLPSFFDNLTVDVILSLYRDSLIIPIVGLIETVSIAKVAATKAKYEINMNQELFSLGMANILGGVFQSYAVAGAFGRSSLHLNSGAKTQLTTIISVLVVGITLLFLTPLFYYLPKVVLSSIVIFAVAPLIDLEEIQNLWRINKVDMLLLLVALWSTLILGVQAGVASAVLLSILLILINSSKPNTSTLGRLAGTASYSDTQLHPEAIIDPNVVIFRFDAPLIFVNAYYLRKKLKAFFKNEEDDDESNITGISSITGHAKKVKAIIMDCSSITSIDSTGVKYLKELIRELVELKVLILFADVRLNVIESLKLAGIYRDVGADHFFMRVHEAKKAVEHLTIRPIIEDKPGLKLNCLRNESDKYQELY
ncbi:Sulfate transporter [Tieghemostelium lacteum]|uniref:Sulfate transporter n=1 Tax=Tieghemostelium lacteum TaxID=361077 RepID=A0A151Z3J7_TIELA|nr:Sulfate transporter [Tieghemostelium lacteum]|eukprot:KYQ88515.1 Sulfate transporter [Tieghemostelium lacteum]